MIHTLAEARRVQKSRKEAGKPGLAAAVSRFLRREYVEEEEYHKYLEARKAHRAQVIKHLESLAEKASQPLPHPGTFRFRFTSPRYVAGLRNLPTHWR